MSLATGASKTEKTAPHEFGKLVYKLPKLAKSHTYIFCLSSGFPVFGFHLFSTIGAPGVLRVLLYLQRVEFFPGRSRASETQVNRQWVKSPLWVKCHLFLGVSMKEEMKIAVKSGESKNSPGRDGVNEWLGCGWIEGRSGWL